MTSTKKVRSPLTRNSTLSKSQGFTLVELAIVILIVSALLLLGIRNSPASRFWRQEAALRELSETFRFLFHQAIADQSFYRIEFDLEKGSYTIGVIRPEPDSDERFQDIAEGAGNISLELNAFLNPSLGVTHTFIPPPDFPSLGEERILPAGIVIEKIYVPSGWVSREEGQKVHVHFSPRGFAEFAVLHIRENGEREITLVNNPFTGLTKVQSGFRDYEWTYGKKES
ncbi:MAG: prepilin-type N-terminal cleavage/methylation domain-containing protein [Bdellovibrionales bacterium]|nr:prepilin-type N-terminal cleavage/methylation domain-containing protein [Bdellovibrionales bacterium]